ncbi:MAG: TetR/AcrR family transcriptional regulator [Planctomycetota bacterium]
MTADNAQELSRRERERLWHRRLILEAAEELFSSRGYHATSVQQIAEEAEFSVGFLYNMFENKEDLYHQLVQQRMEQYEQQVNQRIEEAPDAVEKVRAVVSTKLEFFRQNKQFFNIFMNLSTASTERRPPPFNRAIIERYMNYQAELEDIFRCGIRDGLFADRDPAMAVLALEGVTNAIIRRWSRPVEEKRELVDPETVENLLFHGLLAEGVAHE